MPRKRMIDPGFWEDPTIGTLCIPARLLFIGMISHADDDGRLEVEPRYLRRAVFGFDDVTIADVVELLDEIRCHCRSVHFYTVDGRSFAAFRNWQRYQYIQKPQKSKLPPPPDLTPPDPTSGHYDTDTIPIPDRSDNGNGSVTLNRIEKNRIEQQQQQNARANGDTAPVRSEDDGAVVVVGFLRNHGVGETNIREILTACEGKDLGECLAGWNAVFLGPPLPGLHNKKGLMIARLKQGNLDVPPLPQRERQFDPVTGDRLPDTSILTDEQRKARDAIQAEIDARNPTDSSEWVSFKDMAGRIAATSPQNGIDPSKLLQFKRSV